MSLRDNPFQNMVSLYTVEQEIFARFIFRILYDLTKFTKVYPANLLISQLLYKCIIPYYYVCVHTHTHTIQRYCIMHTHAHIIIYTHNVSMIKFNYIIGDSILQYIIVTVSLKYYY